MRTPKPAPLQRASAISWVAVNAPATALTAHRDGWPCRPQDTASEDEPELLETDEATAAKESITKAEAVLTSKGVDLDN